MPKTKTEKPISKARKPRKSKKITKKKKNKQKAPKPRAFSFKDLNGKTHRLTIKQKKFCEILATLTTNGGQAVIDAGYDCSNKNGSINIKLAWSIASENLRKPKVSEYINVLLKNMRMDDDIVDREHAYIVNQKSDLPSKRGAIDMYYKLKGRYAKVESVVTVKNKLSDLTPDELAEVIATGKIPDGFNNE